MNNYFVFCLFISQLLIVDATTILPHETLTATYYKNSFCNESSYKTQVYEKKCHLRDSFDSCCRDLFHENIKNKNMILDNCNLLEYTNNTNDRSESVLYHCKSSGYPYSYVIGFSVAFGLVFLATIFFFVKCCRSRRREKLYTIIN